MLLKTQVWLMIFDWSDKIATYFDLTACFHSLSLEQWEWVAIMAMTYQLWSAVWGNCAPHLLHMWIVFRMSTKYLTWNAATPKKIEKSFKAIYLSVILVSYLPGWRLQLSKSRSFTATSDPPKCCNLGTHHSYWMSANYYPGVIEWIYNI